MTMTFNFRFSVDEAMHSIKPRAFVLLRPYHSSVLQRIEQPWRLNRDNIPQFDRAIEDLPGIIQTNLGHLLKRCSRRARRC